MLGIEDCVSAETLEGLDYRLARHHKNRTFYIYGEVSREVSSVDMGGATYALLVVAGSDQVSLFGVESAGIPALL